MATENTHYGASRIGDMMRNCSSVFFIGIGGINMSSLALLTHKQGKRVGGSDRVRTALTERLEAQGLCVVYGHEASSVSSYDAVVYTVAISPDNPEYAEAKRLGMPCISRADYMGYLMMAYPRRIGISGMHGKSSCTSMCAQVMIEAGSDPTVLSGAELSIMDGAYRIGNGDSFLFEACEYMDSFLDFNPTVAVILNIEMDHVDYFHSMAQIHSSFLRFAEKVGREGLAVINADDGEIASALAHADLTSVSFGVTSEQADYRAVRLEAVRGRYAFDIVKHGKPFCHVALSVSGKHQVYNALACAAACDLCGIAPEDIAKGLSHYGGARRRMEYRGKVRGAELYEDYGHHPTEIATTLKGAGAMADGRLFCVFQPHTYSRTKALLEDFAEALSVADRVILTDIYAARETDTLGVSSAMLAQAIGERASYASSMEQAARMLQSEVRAGDVAVVMGAGDVYRVFDYITTEK